jgi:hypothetical protein
MEKTNLEKTSSSQEKRRLVAQIMEKSQKMEKDQEGQENEENKEILNS